MEGDGLVAMPFRHDSHPVDIGMPLAEANTTDDVTILGNSR
jgi:hypothetical protein